MHNALVQVLGRTVADLTLATKNLIVIAEEAESERDSRRASRLASLVEIALEESAEWLRELTPEPPGRLAISESIAPQVER